MRVLADVSDDAFRRLGWCKPRGAAIVRADFASLMNAADPERFSGGGLVLLDPTRLREDRFVRLVTTLESSGIRIGVYCEGSPLAMQRVLAMNHRIAIEVVLQGEQRESERLERLLLAKHDTSAVSSTLHQIGGPLRRLPSMWADRLWSVFSNPTNVTAEGEHAAESLLSRAARRALAAADLRPGREVVRAARVSFAFDAMQHGGCDSAEAARLVGYNHVRSLETSYDALLRYPPTAAAAKLSGLEVGHLIGMAMTKSGVPD